jgi:hypothetical protein
MGDCRARGAPAAHSTIFARPALICERTLLPSRRRSRDARVGRGGYRASGAAEPSASI